MNPWIAYALGVATPILLVLLYFSVLALIGVFTRTSKGYRCGACQSEWTGETEGRSWKAKVAYMKHRFSHHRQQRARHFIATYRGDSQRSRIRTLREPYAPTLHTPWWTAIIVTPVVGSLAHKFAVRHGSRVAQD